MTKMQMKNTVGTVGHGDALGAVWTLKTLHKRLLAGVQVR
jgi:hypothetical protein